MNDKALAKEIAKLKVSSSDVSFETLEKILLSIGYTSLLKGTSHRTFRKSGCESITLAKHKPMKKIYVKIVIQAYDDAQKETK